MAERKNGRPARCAIYTRKSSEEGIEQDFNSLHAQREACEAYIKSQRHEGWKVIDTAYDDGGFSGGSMDRPALRRLLADIDAGKIDIVIVYKVDRLTRSLADFAKIVETFDAQGVSFVSVTQQFNTTSSMGRLTLNVLLSFAQFEREVTGERIRDKVAASKKKGMWMGGYVPLGYRAVQKRLVIHETEAKLVREIFALYLKHRNVRKVAAELDRRKVYRPSAIAKTGRTYGKAPFSRGLLYKILGGRIYVGEVEHKGQIYAGQHEAIIDRSTWDAVQSTLAENARERRVRTNAKDRSLLAGLLFDEKGRPFHTNHARKGAKRYRYYVSTVSDVSEKHLRIAAHEIELAVIAALRNRLVDPHALLRLLRARNPRVVVNSIIRNSSGLVDKFETRLTDDGRATFISIVHRVTVSTSELVIEFLPEALVSVLTSSFEERRTCNGPQMGRIEVVGGRNNRAGRSLASQDFVETIRVPITLKQKGIEVRMVIEESDDRYGVLSDPALIKVVARAVTWFEDLMRGSIRDFQELAAREGMTASSAGRMVRLAFLAPDVVEAIMNGTQPRGVTAKSLIRDEALPLLWDAI